MTGGAHCIPGSISKHDYGTPALYPYDGNPTAFPRDRELRGRAYNSLLLTLMESMGLTPEDYQAPGQLGFDNYSDNYENQYSLADAQKPLPFV